MMGRLPKTVYLLAMGVIPLTVWATLTGLLSPGFYASVSTSLEAQARGQDLVTLVFCVPVTFAALILSFRGSQRGDLLLLGQLFYLVYSYVSMLMLLPFNVLWLVYLVIFSASGAAMFIGLHATDAREMASRFETEIHPRRWIGWFEIVAASLVGLMWLSIIVPASIRGALPQAFIEESDGVTVIQMLDLGVLVPLAIAAGVLLLRKRPMGYLLTSLIMVKVVTLTLAVLSMIVFMAEAHVEVNVAQVILFTLLFAFSAALLVLHLRALNMDDDD